MFIVLERITISIIICHTCDISKYLKPTQPFGENLKSKFGTSAVGAPLWQNLALIYAELFQMYDNSRACV